MSKERVEYLGDCLMDVSRETTYEELMAIHREVDDNMVDLLVENRKLKDENWALKVKMERLEKELLYAQKKGRER